MSILMLEIAISFGRLLAGKYSNTDTIAHLLFQIHINLLSQTPSLPLGNWIYSCHLKKTGNMLYFNHIFLLQSYCQALHQAISQNIEHCIQNCLNAAQWLRNKHLLKESRLCLKKIPVYIIPTYILRSIVNENLHGHTAQRDIYAYRLAFCSVLFYLVPINSPISSAVNPLAKRKPWDDPLPIYQSSGICKTESHTPLSQDDTATAERNITKPDACYMGYNVCSLIRIN